MKQKKWVTSILFISILFINGCKSGLINGYIPTDEVTVNSSTVMTSTEEVSISNCAGSSTLIHQAERNFDLIISGKSEILKTQIIANKYSNLQDRIKHIDISVPPNSNMTVLITWQEKVESGSYSIDGEMGAFVARIPIEAVIEEMQLLGCNEINSSSYPQFPWPPPQPSASAEINLKITKKAGSGYPRLRDVDDKITNALVQNGYDERSYWEIPNGFVIATQLERIDFDGVPFRDDRRWENSLSPIRLETFSLNEYLEALFSAPEGRYRVFVFIVTNDIIVQSGTPISQAEAETFGSNGASGLPTEMVSLPFTSNYTCMVYVYEFIQPGIGQVPQQEPNSILTGREHLYRAGLLPYLEETP